MINKHNWKERSINKLTYRGWLLGKFPKQFQYLDKPFDRKVIKIGWQYFVFSLSESDFKKIDVRKKKIFEKLRSTHFMGLCKAFEKRVDELYIENKYYTGFELNCKDLIRFNLNEAKTLLNGECKEVLFMRFKNGNDWIVYSQNYLDLSGGYGLKKLHKMAKYPKPMPMHRMIQPNDHECLPDCVLVRVLIDYKKYLLKKQIEAKQGLI